MNNFNAEDLKILFNIISDLFDANNPGRAYSLMGIYDTAAEAMGFKSWHEELEVS